MQNAWVEFPEATWTRKCILGMLRLALIPASCPSSRKSGAIWGPLSPDTRGAQHDKSEIVLLKNQIIKTVEIQTNPLP
jgi:hypothetical protein